MVWINGTLTSHNAYSLILSLYTLSPSLSAITLSLHSPSFALRSGFPTLPHSPSVSVSLSSLHQPSLLPVVIASRRRWLQVRSSTLISSLILVNIRLCFIWDFDYFVETYLKSSKFTNQDENFVVFYMLQWWWSKVFLAIWLCLCDFLINENFVVFYMMQWFFSHWWV